MFIKTITWRYRSDFHFIAKCEHCEYEHKRGDGYADEHFCLKVVPSQPCAECGKNSYGRTREEQELHDKAWCETHV